MASHPGQKTAIFDSVVALCLTAGTRMFLRRVPTDLHGGFIIFIFIVLEAVTFMVLYQNYGNTFGNFISVTAPNILNFEIKKLKNSLYKPTGTCCINQQIPAA